MKKQFNRNILWSRIFIDRLVSLGVKYACISPGSRNTPLTIAAADNKNLKTFAIIDERSNGFFSLGLAKASNSPVLLFCTSGTASAEFYPAIIEAYQQRVPLIVCTADRPPELLDSGNNQTINQNNIYNNHIRWFFNAGLPEITETRLTHIKKLAERAFMESNLKNKGPVHINFPFRKPFEPSAYTDEADVSFMDCSFSDNMTAFNTSSAAPLPAGFRFEQKGVIVAASALNDDIFAQKISQLSEITRYPILADASSQLRFGNYDKSNLICDFEGILRAPDLSDELAPELILYFGRTITSKALENFISNAEAPLYLINEAGDWFNPSSKHIVSLMGDPISLCSALIERAKHEQFSNDSDYLEQFLTARRKLKKIKDRLIINAPFPFEGRVITETLANLPDEACLMISNSTPVRDLDYFAPLLDKKIRIFNNRGASGIDGIIATALGIASASLKPTYLIIGDLAFYYDMNSLLLAHKNNIPLKIILINNDGGGIFNMLPVAGEKKYFEEYFRTPHGLNFEPFVRGFGGNYSAAADWQDFRNSLENAHNDKKFSVIEIRTNAAASKQIRQKYWKSVEKTLCK